MDNSEKPET